MTYMLGRACAAQVATLAGGAKLTIPPDDVCRHTAEQFLAQENDEHYVMVGEAALRLIGHEAGDYRS